jgi:hypothetical protein
VRDLASRGVQFTGPIEDRGYGRITHVIAPGGIRIQLYEPRYTKRTARPAAKKRATRKPRKPSTRAASSRPRRGAGRRGARSR